MRYTVIGLFIVLVLAGCTSSADPDTTEPAPTADESVDRPNNTVVYTSSGFSPRTITIEQGETVTWVSEGPIMDVASNRHPTHTNYPGTSRADCGTDGADQMFDSCGPQQEYSFTFTETGEWRYHNHANAGHGGTVIVE